MASAGRHGLIRRADVYNFRCRTGLPHSAVGLAQLDDVVELLLAVGLGTSKGDVRRHLDGGGYRCNGTVLEATSQLREQKLLHGRYLLLQRGRKSHHLVEVFS